MRTYENTSVWVDINEELVDNELKAAGKDGFNLVSTILTGDHIILFFQKEIENESKETTRV